MANEDVLRVRQRGPLASIPGAFVVSLFAACALVLYLLWSSYAEARRTMQFTANNVATAVAGELAASREHFAESVAVLATSEAVVDALTTGGEEEAARVQWILAYLRRHHHLTTLTVYDSAGQPRHHTPTPEMVSVADAPWFIRLRAGSATAELTELTGPATAEPEVLIARRILDPGGRFIGVVAASSRLASMSESYAALDVGQHGALVIRRTDDNRLLLRRPAMPDPGARPPVTPVSQRVQAGELAGTAHYVGPDQVRRVYAFRVVDGIPLYINAGLADDDYLVEWRRHAAGMGLAALLVIGTLWVSVLRRAASEAKLAESERLFRSLSDSTPAMVWMSRVDGAAVYVNPAWLRFTGRRLAEELALNWVDDVHPDDRATALAAYARALQAREPFVVEYRKRRHDGEWRWVLDTGRNREGANGESLGFVGTQIDITERKLAETAMADRLKLQQQLTTLAATLPGSIYTFRREPSGEGYFSYYSPKIETLLGQPFEDPRRDSARIFDLIHPDDRERVFAGMREAAKRRDRWQDQFRTVHPDGAVTWVDARSVAVVESDGSVSWHGFIHDVTARQLAEEALRTSEARFRSYIEAAPISILVIGSDGLIRECNSMVGQVLQYPISALRARPFSDLIEDADKDVVNAAFARLVATGIADAEFRVRISTGGRLWAAARGSRLPDGDFLVYVLDVTDRKRSEEALLESERRNRMALDVAELGSFSHDLRADMLTFDERAQLHLGLDSGSMSFEAMMERVPEGDRQRERERILAAHDPGNTDGQYANEKRIVRPDGEVRWVSVKALVEFEGSGDARRATYVIGNTLDITERRMSEQALIESQQRYQSLVDRSPDAIYVSRDGILQFVNPAAVSLFGASSASELIGQPTLRFFAEHEHPIIRERRRQIAAGLSVPTIEHELVRLDGRRRTVEVVAVPNFDGDAMRNELQIILRDITERRAAEMQLAQAQRMEAIGQLTGGLAHDFNNVLGIILGSLDLLSMENIDDESRSLIASARAAANRGADVTRSLLAVVRQSPVSSRVVNVNAVITEMRPLIEQTAGRRVATNFDLVAPRSRVSIDAGSFDTALLNIVINARDAMPEGGQLSIHTRNRRVDAINGVALLPDGDYLEIVVADTGVGMPSEVIAKAFDPFFSTKERGKGTGLGLAMVYGFARQSGGTAFLDSAPDAGTRMHLLLPVASGRDGDDRVSQSEGLPMARAGESVLLVDDETDLRAICGQWLALLGYAVTSVATPDEAMKELTRHAFTALISDVVMPGTMDGTGLASAARRSQPDLAVLLISGYADASVAQSSAPWRLLEKPFRREQLARELRAAIDEASPASGAD